MAHLSGEADTFLLPCGLEIARRAIKAAGEYERIRLGLDSHEGVLLACRSTYPGRYYPRWIGFTRPSIKISLRGGEARIESLNAKGQVLLEAIGSILLPKFDAILSTPHALVVNIGSDILPILRVIIAGMFTEADRHWGLFGAFGHDVALDRYQIEKRQPRSPDQDDVVLYIPDEISVCEDADFASSTRYEYDFRFSGERQPVQDAARAGTVRGEPEATIARPADVDYRTIVADAVDACSSGKLFEVVGSKSFFRQTSLPPSSIFAKLEEINPSPYCFLANFGNEHLIGASPEMFVRVTGQVVETCPIAGTIRRGADAFEDADKILELLNSRKVDAELTMCSDLDFDDKAKVCDPLSIELIGRRQIELYSHVIHTVDHIRGTLREPFDALDAFSAHLWAATLVGAPRKEALEFIEAREGTPRRWYGGAIGRLGFDGNIDTAIVLRAMRHSLGVAEIRVGASLLHSSDPEEEEAEILAKAAAMFKVVGGDASVEATEAPKIAGAIRAPEVAIVDIGGPFLTYLSGVLSSNRVLCSVVDLAGAGAIDWKGRIAVLSPGLDDLSLEQATLMASRVLGQGGAVIGLGHGMLAVAGHFGARSYILDEPRHGVRCSVRQGESGDLIPPVSVDGGQVGIYCRRTLISADQIADLRIVWTDGEGEVLAIEHRTAAAVGLMFQPQSVLSRPKIFTDVLERVQERLLQMAH